MTILVTGVAGFIGHHVASALLDRGERVLGLDDLNAYYAVGLKRDRLARLEGRAGFDFARVDIADMDALADAARGRGVRRIVHLAAQAGVRHSIDNPHAYARANVVGHLNVLELARGLEGLEGVVYASSSSVYGRNERQPFSEGDRTDDPASLYAATKKADELMSAAYADLYGLRLTGLRFFTVYGPWGRPDMAPWLFADAILSGRPIRMFNGGRMRRDFTWIGDAGEAVLAALDRPAAAGGHRVYNVGNGHPQELEHFVSVIEAACGRPAERVYADMQPGDVVETFADVSRIAAELDWRPTTPIERGLPAFVDWLRGYRGRG